MKVSVVTVCYNAGDILEDTIKSVVSQTYGDMEYIIIDGASSDGTVDVIKKYSDKITYWVSEPDKGIYDAMNKGILAATGDYIIFMNAGDRFANSSVVENVASRLNGATVVTGRWHRCYKDGSMKIGSPSKIARLSVDMPICHQATFVKLSYHKANPFDTDYKYSADYNFFYKAWKKGENFSVIDECIADFIVDHGASSDNVSASILERKLAWQGENNLFFRKMHLWYQILRINSVKSVKRLIK